MHACPSRTRITVSDYPLPCIHQLLVPPLFCSGLQLAKQDGGHHVPMRSPLTHHGSFKRNVVIPRARVKQVTKRLCRGVLKGLVNGHRHASFVACLPRRRRRKSSQPVGQPGAKAPKEAARLGLHLVCCPAAFADELVSGASHCSVGLLRGLQALTLRFDTCACPRVGFQRAALR